VQRIRALVVGTAVLLVAGCDQLDGLFGAGAPATPPPAVVTEGRSPESAALKAYYARVERGQRTRGLLRVDGGGPDAPFDARRLGETFMEIAFAREFSDVGTTLVRQRSESILRRWEKPVQIEAIFGASVEPATIADDRAAIRRFSDRLARATGHPVSFVERGGNFRVLVLSEEERRVSGPTLRRLIPGIRDREIDLIEDLGRENYCLVVAADPADDGKIAQAVAVIRDELPLLLRLSCIHEELAQGLGLANDSPTARPSIFNDDDEFGRLTAMDERMLAMLYDPALRPGMDAATARPIVARLARAQLEPSF
jgi:PAS domain-containing protein